MPISKYSKGARKAYGTMTKKYGAKKGRSIFYAMANKYGKRGSSNKSKASQTYSKGTKRKKR